MASPIMEEYRIQVMGLAGRNLGRVHARDLKRWTTAKAVRRNERCSVDHHSLRRGTGDDRCSRGSAGHHDQFRRGWRGRRGRGRGRRTHQFASPVFRCAGIWCRVHESMVRPRRIQGQAVTVASTAQGLIETLVAGSSSGSSTAFGTINETVSNATRKPANPSI